MSREHLTPELQLRLLTPECALYSGRPSVAEREEVERHLSEPFWAIYWPGGQALARYLLDEGERLFDEVRKGTGGLSVLDVGAGCGAASIAAKLAGAELVVANDIDEGWYNEWNTVNL